MYIGQPVRRREDDRFVTGQGSFVDDFTLPNTAYAAFVRSPHAHAHLRGINKKPALDIPGVLAVLSHEDWTEEGLGKFEMVHPMAFSDGRPANEALRSVYSVDRVRHVGKIVALVVAETRNLALDGAEAVEADYQPLPANVDLARALDPETPVIHEHLGTNLAYEVLRGDKEACDAAFANAAHVTELQVDNNRLAGSPIEPRAYVGHYDSVNDRYTLWATCQMPHFWRRWLAVHLLFVPEHKVRVVAPDVGGGFGVKGHGLPEPPEILWAARKVGRPVRWTSTRSEALAGDCHARDHFSHGRMAFDAEGRIIAMEIDTIANFGGYLSNFGPSIPGNSYPQTITGLYTTPTIYFRIRGVYTNTTSVDAYRGSGRPEATWVNERLFENAAREMGIDVVELRRRNIIQKDQFPYPAPAGRTYDTGDPPGLVDKLMALSRYDELRAEQERLRGDGERMGIGISLFLDKSGTGSSRNLASRGAKHGAYEVAAARVHSSGHVTILVGSHSHGQGHETTLAQIAADRLGISMDDIGIVEGDTDRIPMGCGTWGSRSTTMAGTAIVLACDRVIKKATALAAHLLECADTDLDYARSTFTVKGTNRTMTFAAVADAAYMGGNYPEQDFELGLDETVFFDGIDTNDPQAIHLCVVMVDLDTGRVRLRDYFTVDDAGKVINPLLVEGQVHGGLGQGIGQALMENVVYDAQGQLLSGTFMDYAIPRAEDFCDFKLDFQENLAPSNPLGVKGASETGTIGAPACIGNAIIDALWDLGVRHVELPMTPDRVWQAIQAAKATN